MADFSMEADLTFNVDKVMKDLEAKIKTLTAKFNIGGTSTEQTTLLNKNLSLEMKRLSVEEKMIKLSQLSLKKETEKEKTIGKQNEILLKTAQQIQVLAEKTKQFEAKEQLKSKYQMQRLQEKDEYRQKVREERQPLQQIQELFQKILPKPLKSASGDIASGITSGMSFKSLGKIAGVLGMILIAIDIMKGIMDKILNNEFSGYMKATKKLWNTFTNMLFKPFADMIGVTMIPILLKLLTLSMAFNEFMEPFVEALAEWFGGDETGKLQQEQVSSEDWSNIAEMNKKSWENLKSNVWEYWNGLVTKVKEAFGIDVDEGFFQGLWDGIVSKVKTWFGFTQEEGFLQQLWDSIVTTVKGFFNISNEGELNLQTIWNSIVNMINAFFGISDEKSGYVQGKVDSLMDTINGIFEKAEEKKDALSSWVSRQLERLSANGASTGKGTRAIGGTIPVTGLYQLHEGEHVLNRNDTKEYFSSGSTSRQDVNITLTVKGDVSSVQKRELEAMFEKLLKSRSSRSGLSFGGM